MRGFFPTYNFDSTASRFPKGQYGAAKDLFLHETRRGRQGKPALNPFEQRGFFSKKILLFGVDAP